LGRRPYATETGGSFTKYGIELFSNYTFSPDKYRYDEANQAAARGASSRDDSSSPEDQRGVTYAAQTGLFGRNAKPMDVSSGSGRI
jgi:hypothetical protein